MTESFTETSKISYGTNIKNSFGGCIIGLIIFLLAFVVLWKNEGNNVAQIAKANYIKKTAIEISADKIERENDNKLVQLSGNAITDTTLSDGIVTLPKVFALARKVEMYQWEESVETTSKDELGGSTTETKTYTYDKVWSGVEINSKNFKKQNYKNPPFPIKSATLFAKSGKLGEFTLTNKQSQAMHDYTEYDELPPNHKYKIFENKYYTSINPENPAIGDIRISYGYVPTNTEISIIGRQKSDNTLTSYSYKDSPIYLQQSGEKTKGEMVSAFRKGNRMITNLFRILGWFMMYIGLNMFINPLVVIFKVVPFVESIVGFLTSSVIFLISVALSLLTISIAWFAYRPFLTLGVLAVIGLIVYEVKRKMKEQG
ncbi:MAG: TMEM43 family protein [Cyanobacteria bacterium RUI128]|nr:TMEM43 family protein [Cyanobacteria bacterium RUI128]